MTDVNTQALRAITAPPQLKPASEFQPGPAPMLQWVRIEDLVVDETYQRPIASQGRANVTRIAEAFDWSKFAPLICAPVAGGKFAVIDGQHRATAAAARSVESVPAMIVIADRARQAEAFAAVNAQVTRLNAIQIFKARLQAKEPKAMAATAACEAAGVRLVGAGVAAGKMKPGDCAAVGAVEDCLQQYGHAALVTALMCVTETSNNEPGALTSALIKGLCIFLAARPAWREAGEVLLGAMDEIDLEDLTIRGRVRAMQTKGLWAFDAVAQELATLLGNAPSEAAAA